MLRAVAAAVLLVLAIALPAGAGEGPTKLLDASAGPRTGTSKTTISFTVTYRNREGSAPDYVRVLIDGSAHAMSGDGGTDWKHGVEHRLLDEAPGRCPRDRVRGRRHAALHRDGRRRNGHDRGSAAPHAGADPRPDARSYTCADAAAYARPDAGAHDRANAEPDHSAARPDANPDLNPGVEPATDLDAACERTPHAREQRRYGSGREPPSAAARPATVIQRAARAPAAAARALPVPATPATRPGKEARSRAARARPAPARPVPRAAPAAARAERPATPRRIQEPDPGTRAGARWPLRCKPSDSEATRRIGPSCRPLSGRPGPWRWRWPSRSSARSAATRSRRHPTRYCRRMPPEAVQSPRPVSSSEAWSGPPGYPHPSTSRQACRAGAGHLSWKPARPIPRATH